jgi:ankyrin repeat protein
MSVNLTNTNGFTSLHVSAEFGHLETTKTLVEGGAAINNTNKYSHAPLLVVAYNRKSQLFRFLTGIGADIIILDEENNTVLHIAAESGM